jgi:hypothetical protein
MTITTGRFINLAVVLDLPLEYVEIVVHLPISLLNVLPTAVTVAKELDISPYIALYKPHDDPLAETVDKTTCIEAALIINVTNVMNSDISL